MSPPISVELREDTLFSPDSFGENGSRGELIRLDNITKTYRIGEQDVSVLKGVSLTIGRGEMVALMGSSGSGKTTLMNILGCLDRPTSGSFWFDGQDMSQLSANQRAILRSSKLGFVFQSFHLLPRTSALRNVMMPLDYALCRPSRSESVHTAEMLLDQLGLASRTHHESSQMSGGQQQRVAIARALVNRPALLLADEPTGNLDSRTGDEILRLFQRLNAQGVTIIVVTHDAKVAGYANRTIRIADGRIDEEHGSLGRCRLGETHPSGAAVHSISSRHTLLAPLHIEMPYGDGAIRPATNEAGGAVLATAPAKSRPATRLATAVRPLSMSGSSLATEKRSGGGYLLPPTLRTALVSLTRNRLRSALTALGVIIGVAAVIAMTEIGQGTKKEIEKAVASMGANKLPIFPSAVSNGGVSQGAGTFQTLKPADVEAIAQQCPAVTVAVPMVWAQAQLIYGKRNWAPMQVTGTTPGYLATRDWEDLQEGECFSDYDVQTCNTVCLIGNTVKRELFDDESPVGKMIRVRNVPFRVVGVLGERGANMMGQDQDDCLIAPWTTIKFRVNGQGAGSLKTPASAAAGAANLSNPYPTATPLYPQASAAQLANFPQPVRQVSVDFIQAKAASAELIPLAVEQISGVLRDRHHLSEGQDDDFKILNMAEIARAAGRTSELMGTLLLVVAAISLVVGGVGIMNIMLVSVTERTREIGLRMAVGARRHHILRQFLMEATLLCLAGGAIGILLGRLASIVIRETQHWTTEPSLTAIAIAALVSAGVGVVFGFYPAWKASRLQPIDALRSE